MVERFNSTPIRRMTTGGSYVNLTADVVLASDYANLERQLAEARAKIDVQRESKEYAQRCCEAAEAKRDRLAADLEYWQTVKHSSHWKAQVEAMAPALRQCQKILAVLSRPEGQADISILWAQCVEAEAKARAALAGKE